MNEDPNLRSDITDVFSQAGFAKQFQANLSACDWTPHPAHSVFTQYDASYYLSRRTGFEQKYRCMWAVSRTIRPKKIVELGTHAGSSADAYISATRGMAGNAPESHAEYVGYDVFGSNQRENGGGVWEPLAECEKLFRARGFSKCRLEKVDLRRLTEIESADFVVVDAAHDFHNASEDLKLALTANPRWIFVDDFHGHEVRQAVAEFGRAIGGRLAFQFFVDYPDGGLVICLEERTR